MLSNYGNESESIRVPVRLLDFDVIEIGGKRALYCRVLHRAEPL
jgi:hypothetical protein